MRAEQSSTAKTCGTLKCYPVRPVRSRLVVRMKEAMRRRQPPMEFRMQEMASTLPHFSEDTCSTAHRDQDCPAVQEVPRVHDLPAYPGVRVDRRVRPLRRCHAIRPVRDSLVGLWDRQLRDLHEVLEVPSVHERRHDQVVLPLLPFHSCQTLRECPADRDSPCCNKTRTISAVSSKPK